MAKNLKDEEIRNQRILEVANYVKETKASTRKAAKYFSEHHYPISNATVNDYLRNRLPKINPELGREVALILDGNTPKSVEAVEVKKRIYSAVSLLFQDYTVPEIAKKLTTTPDVIYQDLTVRLAKIEKDPAIVELVQQSIPGIDLETIDIVGDVQQVFDRHRKENLKNQEGNEAPFDKSYFQENEVERDAEGKFVSFPHKK